VDFCTSALWEAPRTLADRDRFSVAIQNPDHLHLAIVRILEDENLPAGVYYLGSMTAEHMESSRFDLPVEVLPLS